MQYSLPYILEKFQSSPEQYYREIWSLADDGLFWDMALEAWVVCSFDHCLRLLESPLMAKSRLAIDPQVFPKGRRQLVEDALPMLARQMFFDDSAESRASQEAWRRRLATGGQDEITVAVEAAAERLVMAAPRDISVDINEITRAFASACIFERMRLGPTEQSLLYSHAERYAQFLDGKVDSVAHFLECLESLTVLVQRFSGDALPPSWPVIGTDQRRAATDGAAVLTAGHESVAYLLGTVLRACERLGPKWPNEQELLALVHEGLRLDPPIQMVGRIARASIRLGSREIPPGATVFLHLGAAHHDPAVFERPEHFEPGRRARPHIAFGRGSGKCIGTSLAVTAAWGFLKVLARRQLSVEVVTNQIAWESGLSGRAYRLLPVILR